MTFNDALFDLFFECPPFLFRLVQINLESRILILKRFILRFKIDYLFTKHSRQWNLFQQVQNTHNALYCFPM